MGVQLMVIGMVLAAKVASPRKEAFVPLTVTFLARVMVLPMTASLAPFVPDVNSFGELAVKFCAICRLVFSSNCR
jgi:hypothetical protein